MTHKEVFHQLIAGKALQTISGLRNSELKIPYSNVKIQCFDNIREWGPPNNKKVFNEFDAIATYFMYNDLSRRKEIFYAAFECKTNIADLFKDNKFEDYIGSCEYNYLVVPSNLIFFAIKRLERYPDDKMYGIISFETGEVIIPAFYDNNVDIDRNRKISANLFRNPKKFEGGDYQIFDKSIPAVMNDFDVWKGRLVYKKYIAEIKSYYRVSNKVLR